MRIAVLSDPHGDLVALNKVISDLEAASPIDEVLMGGDLAQGGSQPAEVVDEIRRRDWVSVRGNADELVIRVADGDGTNEPIFEAHGEKIPDAVVSRARWSAGQLGPERIQYLRSLPLSIQRGPFPFGMIVLVHATPWSTEDVVLPDADMAIAERMVRSSGARLLVYGHIHTAYHRRVGDGVILSAGAVSGSNDADPRPAYTILTLGDGISTEVRRVDWPLEERLEAYAAAGIELSPERRASFVRPGPLPVRSQPGVMVSLGS